MGLSKDVYFKAVLDEMPRLLGQLNRNPASKSYGSFDRQFWHYRTNDISCARMQEAVLTLALMYKINRKDNPYYLDSRILEWIKTGIHFWRKIQRRNGSFSEWYPNEDSFVVTAFTSYAISETILILGKDFGLKTRRSLIKAGDWLLKHREDTAQNQLSGAVIALYNIYLVTGLDRFKKGSQKKFEMLASMQDKEGWFSEYNGADIGYLSLLVDYISKYYDKTRDKMAFKVLDKSIGFLSYFVHPGFTFGGEYGSRNTEYLIPSGFEYLVKLSKSAESICYHIRKSILNGTSISPGELDDRYLTYITYNWLQAYLYGKDSVVANKSQYKKNFSKNFNNAGLWVYSNKDHYCIVNYKKGGCYKIFSNSNCKCNPDSGLIIKCKGKRYITQIIQNNNISFLDVGIEVKGRFSRFKENQMTPMKNILLRGFQISFGKIGFFSKLLKDFFRKSMIMKNKTSDITFCRRIFFDNGFIVEDTISSPRVISELFIGYKTSFSFIPSSKYFTLSELGNQQHRIFPKKKRILVKRVFDKQGELRDIFIS